MSMYVQNILAWRELAAESDVHAGRDWYPIARNIARQFADTYGIPLDVSAGVIAVLSPSTEWMANVRGAETIIRAHARGESMPGPGEVETTYYTNVIKAWRILSTGSDFPRCDGTRIAASGRRVKCNPTRDDCPARAHLHGPKVSEFHATILGKLDGRVVDVWATRAADVGPYDVLSLAKDDPRRIGVPGSRFTILQDAYSEAARIRGESPAVIQAIVWTYIRRVWRNPVTIAQSEFPF